MRYISGTLYALAIAAHHGELLDMAVVGLLVFLGTVCFAAAVQAMIDEALRPKVVEDEPDWFCATPVTRRDGWRGL